MEEAVALHGREMVRKIGSDFLIRIYKDGDIKNFVPIYIKLVWGKGSIEFTEPWVFANNEMSCWERHAIALVSGQMSMSEAEYGGYFRTYGITKTSAREFALGFLPYLQD